MTRIVALSVWAVYWLVFMEWLFFATKPSFMSPLPWSERLLIALIAPLPGVIVGGLILGAFFTLRGVVQRVSTRDLVPVIALGLPAAVLSASFFLMVDNFTYTVLRFGVFSVQTWWRLLYGVLYGALFAFMYKALVNAARGHIPPIMTRILTRGAGGLVAASLAAAVVAYAAHTTAANGHPSEGPEPLRRPNIVLFASDGLSAGHLSAYGYERDTTPYLKSILSNGLVAENAFSNAGNTGASVTSMLTGKLPTQTRVIYPPDVLRGADSFEHLPGILKRLGYYTVDISIRHFADAYDLNLQNGFDVASGRTLGATDDGWGLTGWAWGTANPMLNSTAYFLGRIEERLSGRLRHAFGLEKGVNPFDEVAGAGERMTFPSDSKRLSDLGRVFDEHREPFFAHVHLMKTHGPGFSPSMRIFSEGKTQDAPWQIDFYDDAISDVDADFEVVMKYLASRGKLDNTIVVFNSDHGMEWRTDVRIPLIFFFPDNAYAGRLSTTAQLLDVAPTLLDYMGVDRPPWMTGRSLIGAELDRRRPVISTQDDVGIRVKRGGLWLRGTSAPPFFGLGALSMVVCDKAFKLDVTTNTLSVDSVAGVTTPCDASDVPDVAVAREYLVQHLREQGYDASSLQASTGGA
ncbi:MAG: sulfatase-like hydrolase/transferase [Nitrospirota bacterium]